MNDLTPRLRAILSRCLTAEDAERCLRELSREMHAGVPLRRTVYYRLDEKTGRSVAVRRPSSRCRVRR